jgi:hypothetical protein
MWMVTTSLDVMVVRDDGVTGWVELTAPCSASLASPLDVRHISADARRGSLLRRATPPLNAAISRNSRTGVRSYAQDTLHSWFVAPASHVQTQTFVAFVSIVAGSAYRHIVIDPT